MSALRLSQLNCGAAIGADQSPVMVDLLCARVGSSECMEEAVAVCAGHDHLSSVDQPGSSNAAGA